MLGDDVVIADAQVAEVYFQSLQQLGVPISTQKSLISDTGAFEFAKRFCVKGGRVDLSAMSSRTPPWISGMVTRRSLLHGFLSRA